MTKIKKVLILLVLAMGLAGTFWYTSAANADTLEYSYTLAKENPDSLHCSIYANGGYLIVPIHIDHGDNVRIHFKNQTGNTFDLYSIYLADFLNEQPHKPSPIGEWAHTNYEDYGPLDSTVSLDNIQQEVFIVGEFGEDETNGCSGLVGVIRIYTDGRPPAAQTSPPSSPPKTAKKATPPAETPSAADPTPPEPPKLGAVTVDGKILDTNDTPEVEQSKSLVLMGTAPPNATVNLTIHSTPKTATVKADPEGSWSYAITGLELGDHYVEASVVDPVTGQASPKATILSFKVTETTKIVAGPANNSTSKVVAAALGAALVLAGLGLVFRDKLKRLIARRPKRSKKRPVKKKRK